MFKFKKGYYADIRIEESFTSSVRYTNEALDEAKERNENRAFIRVFNGSRWYYASVTDIACIQKELDTLYDMLPANENIDENEIVKRYEVNKDKILLYTDTSFKNVPLIKKMELCQSYFETLRLSEYGIMSGIIYADKFYNRKFYSSKGADIEYDFQLGGIAWIKALKNGEENRQFMETLSALKFEELYGHNEMVAEKLAETENALLHSVACEPGVYPVILSPITTGIFAHESFGHKSEADFMIGDEKMKKEWVMGKKVGSDILTITDCGKNIGSGYTPYDDEGTKTKMTYLIKNGVLSGRLHSATTAAILDEELTGNARAVNCTFEPIVRMTETVVGAGENTFDELVSRIKKGYFIKTCKHGSGMSTFTIAPDLVYEIVDGKLGRPVRVAVITGNVFETLGLIDGATKDVEVRYNVFGGCGKNEQFPLPVGFGGPYLSVSKMNVM